MNPSYFRIRQPLDKAMERFAQWLSLPEVERPITTDLVNAVECACDEQGQWRGSALFVYENDGWTVFEDLSGDFSFVSVDSWLGLAGNDGFVFAGYNTSFLFGRLVVIEGGNVIREFCYFEDDPGAFVDKGQLAEEETPMKTWVEVASFADSDGIVSSDKGLLWLHRRGT